MTDDKPVFGRRRVLGGMATIGVAGALGAGAWAGNTDQEDAQLTSEAGTLDIELAYDNEVYDGNTLPIAIGGINPGETKDMLIHVRNPPSESSITAQAMSVAVNNVETGEGDNPEPETNTDGDGELDDQLEMSVSFDANGGTDLIGAYKNNYIPFNDVADHGPYTANGIDFSPKEHDYDYQDLQVSLHYKDLDPSQNNEAEGDTVKFDLDVGFFQNEQDVSSGAGNSSS